MSDKAVSIVDFLLARISEKEKIARDAGGEAWYAAKVPGETIAPPDVERHTVIDSPSSLVSYEVVNDRFAHHIEANSPVDVIEQCRAIRMLIIRFQTLHGSNSNVGAFGTRWSERFDVLRVLAAAYSDHPDYCEAWGIL